MQGKQSDPSASPDVADGPVASVGPIIRSPMVEASGWLTGEASLPLPNDRRGDKPTVVSVAQEVGTPSLPAIWSGKTPGDVTAWGVSAIGDWLGGTKVPPGTGAA
jgi:hypothetical protein